MRIWIIFISFLLVTTSSVLTLEDRAEITASRANETLNAFNTCCKAVCLARFESNDNICFDKDGFSGISASDLESSVIDSSIPELIE